MSEFSGRTVVVTGASSGIGRALCLGIAPQRPNLVLAARDTARLEEVAAECCAKGAEPLVVSTDVTSEDACRNLIERTVERFGGIDIAFDDNLRVGRHLHVNRLALHQFHRPAP